MKILREERIRYRSMALKDNQIIGQFMDEQEVEKAEA